MKELFPEAKGREEKHVRSYIPSPFIVAGLPARDVKNLPFQRKYNGITLTLNGADHVPYGKYGRLLLTILTTHAVLNKNSGEGTVTIEYKSLSSLLKELQLPKQRGKDIRDQLEYFANSAFIFNSVQTTKGKKSTLKDLFSQEEYDQLSPEVKMTHSTSGMIRFMEYFSCIDVESDNHTNSAAITIKLSSEFSRYSQEHSVPIDYTIYKSITSPIGKDLYSWLMYRCNSLCDSELFIPQQALIDQFMPVDNESAGQNWRNYEYLKERIQEIKAKYCPELNVFFEKGGILLKKSNLPDLKNQYYVLVTANI